MKERTRAFFRLRKKENENMSHLNKLNSVLCSAAVALSVFGTPVSVFAEDDQAPVEEKQPVESENQEGTDNGETGLVNEDENNTPADANSKGDGSSEEDNNKKDGHTDGDAKDGDPDNPDEDKKPEDKPAGDDKTDNNNTPVIDVTGTLDTILKDLEENISDLAGSEDASSIKDKLTGVEQSIQNWKDKDEVVAIKNLKKIRDDLETIKTSAASKELKEKVDALLKKADLAFGQALIDAVKNMSETVDKMPKPDGLEDNDWQTIKSALNEASAALSNPSNSMEDVAAVFTKSARQISSAISKATDAEVKKTIENISTTLKQLADILDPSAVIPPAPTLSQAAEVLKGQDLTVKLEGSSDSRKYTIVANTVDSVGDVALQVGTADTYLVPVKIKTKTYLDKFKTDENLKKVEGDATLKANLKYDSANEKWVVNDIPTLVVTGEESAVKYTVTLKTDQSTTWRTVTATVETGKTSATVNLPNAKPTRSGYTFVAWKNESTGKTYKAGEQIVIKGDVTLVATWKTGTDNSSPNTAAMNPAGDSAFFATTLAAAAGLGVLAAVKAFRKD